MFMDAFWIVSSFPSHSWVEMEKCDKLGALFNSRYPPSMKNVATVQCSLSVTSSGQRTSRTVDCRACWPIWTRRHRERCCWSWLQSDWNVSARVLISPKNVGLKQEIIEQMSSTCIASNVFEPWSERAMQWCEPHLLYCTTFASLTPAFNPRLSTIHLYDKTSHCLIPLNVLVEALPCWCWLDCSSTLSN